MYLRRIWTMKVLIVSKVNKVCSPHFFCSLIISYFPDSQGRGCAGCPHKPKRFTTSSVLNQNKVWQRRVPESILFLRNILSSCLKSFNMRSVMVSVFHLLFSTIIFYWSKLGFSSRSNCTNVHLVNLQLGYSLGGVPGVPDPPPPFHNSILYSVSF